MPQLNVNRRNFLKLGTGFIGTTSLTTIISETTFNISPALADNGITPDEALQRLIEGNERFVEQKRTNPRQNMSRLLEVAKGQNPFAAVLSCADSRVPVEIIFDQGLGDIFVVRNAGNIATSEEIGSLEFGTLVLGCKVLLVIGHESCGAIKATMKGGELPGEIGSIVEHIQPAIEQYSGLQDSELMVKKATIANVNHQVTKLKESPVITDLINQNKLKIIGSYYDLDTGKIALVD